MGKKKPKKEKITNESLLAKMKYDFSRDAEWFKRTNQKILETKEELNKNFYDETKKKQKIDFIHRLKDKLKDYKDAIKFESRYKKVRFFERRKLERKLKQINKNIENEKNEEKIKELKEERQNIIDNINYVKYYPRTYKYYSLFPNKDADKEEMIKKREKMKQKIKFFLNGKKNKRNEEIDNEQEEEKKTKNEEENEIDDENDENNDENNDDIDLDENDVNNNEKDENSNSENEKNEKKQKDKKKEKKEKKERKEKKEKKEKKDVGKDYESFKKKKVLKDDFFELDE